jgi:hypothetical protein
VFTKNNRLNLSSDLILKMILENENLVNNQQLAYALDID